MLSARRIVIPSSDMAMMGPSALFPWSGFPAGGSVFFS